MSPGISNQIHPVIGYSDHLLEYSWYLQNYRLRREIVKSAGGASKHKDAIKATSKKRDYIFHPPDRFTCKDRGCSGSKWGLFKAMPCVSGSMELVAMWWPEDCGVMVR